MNLSCNLTFQPKLDRFAWLLLNCCLIFQFKRVHHAVESSGGVALLKDTPGSESDGGLVSKDVCVMMMDNKEKNSLSAESLQWVLHITETLTRFGLTVKSIWSTKTGHNLAWGGPCFKVFNVISIH